MLRALVDFLGSAYIVISLDFQTIEYDEFASGNAFVHALAREINKKIRLRKDVPDKVMGEMSGGRFGWRMSIS